MRRRTLAALAVGVVTIACVAVLVAGLTGMLTVVITHGDSMEPTYAAGDVVVVAHTDTYATGDVAAYHSPLLGQIVLHRIVGADSEGFVLRGDNNSWLDTERPTADELIGTARLRIPKLGVPARWLAAHTPLGAPLGAAGAVLLAAAAITTTAARTPAMRNPAVHTRPPPVPGGRAAAHHQLTAGLLVGLVAFAFLAAASWTRPATTTGPIGYTHTGEFTYAATAVQGPVYDAPTVRTGQPLFLRLIDDVRVGFAYRFDAAEPASTRGTIGLRATVDNATGWSRTLQLAAPAAFDSDTATVTGDLDLTKIRALVTQAAQATGESGATTITLRPHVRVNGDIAGHPFQNRYDPSLAYQLTDTQLRPLDETDGHGDATLRTHQTGEVHAPGRQPALLTWAGRAIAVDTARRLSVAAVVTCAAGLLLVVAAARRTARLSEPQRITRRWPDLIVPAHLHDLWPARSVSVTDVHALVTLARRSGRLILHDPDTGVFLLDLDGTHYRYPPPPAQAPPPPAVPPTPAAPHPTRPAVHLATTHHPPMQDA